MILVPELKAKFDKLTLIEKNAYAAFLVSFFVFIEDKIVSKDIKEQSVIFGLATLTNEIFEYLGFKPEAIEEARKFDDESLIPPIYILKFVKDLTVLNPLLDTCNAIIQCTSNKNYMEAWNYLVSSFEFIGFKRDEIEESFDRVANSNYIAHIKDELYKYLKRS